MGCQTVGDALDVCLGHDGIVSAVLPSGEWRKIFDIERTGDCPVDSKRWDIACLSSVKRMGRNACLSVLGWGIGGNRLRLIGDDFSSVTSGKDYPRVDRLEREGAVIKGEESGGGAGILVAVSGCGGTCGLGQGECGRDSPWGSVSICIYGKGRGGADGLRLRGDRYGDGRGEECGHLAIGHVKQQKKAQDEQEREETRPFFPWRGRVLGQGHLRVWCMALDNGGFLLVKWHL